jgi:hypothetical protein
MNSDMTTTHVCDELHIAWFPAGLPHSIRSSPELARPNDPNVGCELPPHFVTKTQADLEIGQTRAQLTRGISFAVQIGFAFRLKDQPLCKEQLVFGLEPHGRAPLRTDIERRPGVEPIGRQSLDAGRRPSAPSAANGDPRARHRR